MMNTEHTENSTLNTYMHYIITYAPRPPPQVVSIMLTAMHFESDSSYIIIIRKIHTL